jgi:hypothetical protein
MAAVQLNFTLRTSSNCKTVHLIGSWDSYKSQLPLSKDSAKQGGWKGTFRFQGSTLKPGSRYWYYVCLLFSPTYKRESRVLTKEPSTSSTATTSPTTQPANPPPSPPQAANSTSSTFPLQRPPPRQPHLQNPTAVTPAANTPAAPANTSPKAAPSPPLKSNAHVPTALTRPEQSLASNTTHPPLTASPAASAKPNSTPTAKKAIVIPTLTYLP